MVKTSPSSTLIFYKWKACNQVLSETVGQKHGQNRLRSCSEGHQGYHQKPAQKVPAIPPRKNNISLKMIWKTACFPFQVTRIFSGGRGKHGQWKPP